MALIDVPTNATQCTSSSDCPLSPLTVPCRRTINLPTASTKMPAASRKQRSVDLQQEVAAKIIAHLGTTNTSSISSSSAISSSVPTAPDLPVIKHPHQDCLFFWSVRSASNKDEASHYVISDRPLHTSKPIPRSYSNNTPIWKLVAGLTRNETFNWCTEMARLQLVDIAFTLDNGSMRVDQWREVLANALVGDCVVPNGPWHKVLGKVLSKCKAEERVDEVMTAAQNTNWKAEVSLTQTLLDTTND